MLAAGNMNLTPWGGPTARAASALHVDVNALFVPLIPTMVACFGFAVFVAWVLGRRERARIGVAACRSWTTSLARWAARWTRWRAAAGAPAASALRQPRADHGR